MRILPVLLASLALAFSAHGQGVGIDPTPTPEPPVPVAAPPLFKLAVPVAPAPPASTLKVPAATVATRRQVIQAVATRAATMTVDRVQTTDVDLLGAALNFAAQDPRYQEIDRLSHYGVKLSQIEKKIEAEGLTAANKATFLQLYRDATAALKAFLAAEAADASQ